MHGVVVYSCTVLIFSRKNVELYGRTIGFFVWTVGTTIRDKSILSTGKICILHLTSSIAKPFKLIRTLKNAAQFRQGQNKSPFSLEGFCRKLESQGTRFNTGLQRKRRRSFPFFSFLTPKKNSV